MSPKSRRPRTIEDITDLIADSSYFVALADRRDRWHPDPLRVALEMSLPTASPSPAKGRYT